MLNKDGHLLEVGLIRYTVDNRLSALSGLQKRIKSDGFRYAHLFPSKDGKKVQSSWSDSNDTFDYASIIYESLDLKEYDNQLFIEEHSKGEFVLVRVDNGVIVSDERLIIKEAVNKINDVLGNDREMEVTRKVLLLTVANQDVRTAAAVFGVIENVPEEFWDGQLERGLENYQFKLLKDARKSKGIKRPKAGYIWAAAAVILIGTQFSSFKKEDVSVERFVPEVDHFAQFKSSLTMTEISPVNRLKEDYNMMILIGQLPGWQLKSVAHVRDVATYTVEKIQGNNSGTVAQLISWARENGFQTGRIDGSYSLMRVPANIPVHASDDGIYMHSVENVTNTLTDAVTLWIPDAQIIVYQEQAQAGGRWRKRNIGMTLSGQYREDLITFAAILEALDLPIALQEASYQVANEQLSGQILMTIFGE